MCGVGYGLAALLSIGAKLRDNSRLTSPLYLVGAQLVS